MISFAMWLSFCYIWRCLCKVLSIFFFKVPPTTEINTLSLHDALPISLRSRTRSHSIGRCRPTICRPRSTPISRSARRSEEHTSELQSHSELVCRLLLEKKKYKHIAARYVSNEFYESITRVKLQAESDE